MPATRERLLADYIWFAVSLAAIFGLVIGSFLNVCIYRVPRDLSVVTPRSFCPECGAQLTWRENIPIVSFVIQRGRCRNCNSPIGKRYPAVELTTALAFAAVVFKYGITPVTVKWLLFEAISITLLFTDFEERILPDEFTLGGAVVGLIFAAFVRVPGTIVDLVASAAGQRTRSYISALLGALVLAGPAWLLGVTYQALRKREGLGFGDVKLLVTMGVFLGLEYGLTAFLWSAIAGAVIGIAYALITKQKMSTLELPFGSFLCAGAGLVPLVYDLRA